MRKLELPFILAGPIVRRVECDRVFLWVATSRKTEIEASLYLIQPESQSNSSYEYQMIAAKTETTSIRAGKRLYIHLIKIVPVDVPFPVDSLIGYNLHFSHNLQSEDLESLHYLTSTHPGCLVYGNLKYPSFVIKSGNTQSNIIYGSCRKPHGEEQDALALADRILEKEYNNINKRPDSLFLMGDQIYADDVADPIILPLSTLSRRLIGSKESLFTLDSRLSQEPNSAALTKISGRQFIIEKIAQFTTSHPENHLIELGEYAAMYLLAWNPEIWAALQTQHLLPSFEEAEKANMIHYTFPNNCRYKKEHKKEREKLKERFLDQQEALISFQDTLWRVRRLLANLPTYMIFDDHDITDDWNLSAEWKMNVNSAPLGKHIIANGLTAYWLFQGWGNDPDAFDDVFIKNMVSYSKSLRKGNSLQQPYQQWLETLWNYKSWHYTAPTYPIAVFLDTRTMRDYDTNPKPIKFGSIIKETEGCPQLVSQEGWSDITLKLHASGWKNGTPLIVVSATPVYGMGLIESFLHDYVYPFQVIGVKVQTSFDFEAWKYNGKGFTEFLTQTSNWNPSHLIILSGDVHYASAVKATVTFANNQTLSICQLTSSPFKNMSFSGVWGLLMKLVIGVNAYSRKRNDIQRSCSLDYTITHHKINSQTTPYIWQDRLRYQVIDHKSIIATSNNLGLVSISDETIQNQLIK
ncbi:hypothetical protein [Bacillus sp. USDA818B3_A]|uniref:hypothetical protein n=1 Tax=Bacillus sp. USDA818B3_A TaxID=2698834 RepID=UPI00136C4C9C|nr:hypothetical protein [Bacillus sp. USDA818B3_A]